MRQPNLVIAPAAKQSQPAGSRLTTVRDELISVIFYAYQTDFGTEKGLFGSGNFKGITEIGEALEAFLMTNKFVSESHPHGLAIPSWQGTEYPKWYERNFELLGEVRVTMSYRIRGT